VPKNPLKTGKVLNRADVFSVRTEGSSFPGGTRTSKKYRAKVLRGKRWKKVGGENFGYRLKHHTPRGVFPGRDNCFKRPGGWWADHGSARGAGLAGRHAKKVRMSREQTG